MPAKRGSLMAELEDPKLTVEAFLAEARNSVRAGEVHVSEVSRRESAEIDDHSYPVTTGYTFPFRGQRIRVDVEHPNLIIGTDKVGDVVDGRLFDELKDACAERHVMQEHSEESDRREAAEARTLAARTKRLGPLAARLRCTRPRAKSSRKPLKKKH